MSRYKEHAEKPVQFLALTGYTRTESEYNLPKGCRLAQDSGFQGFAPENIVIIQPKKKPRGKELSDLDKHINQWGSSLRIHVEHGCFCICPTK